MLACGNRAASAWVRACLARSAAIWAGAGDGASLPELLEREGRIERAQRNAYYEIGLELRAIRDSGLYKIDRAQQIGGRYSFQTFEEYVQERWEMDLRRANQLILAASTVLVLQNRKNFSYFPSKESHVTALLALESDTERAAVWQEIVLERNGQPMRASDGASLPFTASLR